jgi:outer membrane protein TolC
MKNLLAIIGLLLLYTNIFAQKVLNLEDAISIALKESYGIKNAEYSLEESEKNLQSFRAGLFSRLDLEFDVPNYISSLSSQFNPTTGKEEFYEIGSTRIEGRLSLNQPIIFTNGNIRVTGSIFGRDQFGPEIADFRDYYTNLQISLNQPLFIFNSQAADLERAEINLDKAQRNYTQSELDVIYNVTVGFYSLYRAKENVSIAEEKMLQNEESYQTAANKLRAGLIAEVEALQLEIDLASSKNALLDAERRYREELNDFKILIGLELEDGIDIVSNLVFEPVQVDSSAAVESALTKRPELLNQEKDIYLSELNVDETDSERQIKAEINARYGINKNEQDLSAVFSNFLQNQSVSLTVSVPVWDWSQNEYRVQAAEADLKQQKLRYDNMYDNIKKDIIEALGRLKSAEERVKVLGKSVEVANKSYNISLQRFKSGTITSFDLSQTQIRLTEARLNSLGALIDYNVALADLERKTLMKF